MKKTTKLTLVHSLIVLGSCLAFSPIAQAQPKFQGTLRSTAQVRTLVSERAAAGEADAQYRLGRMYEFGEGVRADSVAAVKWYRKAAEQGLARAEYNLGRMYADGDGVGQDREQAAVWLCKAAAQNYSLALNRLGMMSERGQGLPRDYVQAHKFFTLAAAAGNIAGEVNRDHLRPLMTASQIAEAERLAGTNISGTLAVSTRR